MITAGICYALLANLPSPNLKGKYACMCIAAACVYATFPTFARVGGQQPGQRDQAGGRRRSVH
jgi:hypothetical protein